MKTRRNRNSDIKLREQTKILEKERHKLGKEKDKQEKEKELEIDTFRENGCQRIGRNLREKRRLKKKTRVV